MLIDNALDQGFSAFVPRPDFFCSAGNKNKSNYIKPKNKKKLFFKPRY